MTCKKTDFKLCLIPMTYKGVEDYTDPRPFSLHPPTLPPKNSSAFFLSFNKYYPMKNSYQPKMCNEINFFNFNPKIEIA